MNMYKNNLGIETDCVTGTPTYEKPAAAELHLYQ